MDINRIGYNKNINTQNEYQKKLKEIREEKELKSKENNQTNNISAKFDGNSRKYVDLANRFPEVREALVNEMKYAIENNLYEIDVDKITNKLLGD